MTIVLNPIVAGGDEVAPGTGAFWTAHDVQDRLLDFCGGSSEGRNLKQVRRAMLDAIRDVPNERNWQFYYRRDRIATTAQYNTGTIAFDLTGGTYERMVTLTDGTWPTDAWYGILQVDGVEYEIESKKSSTVITLKLNSCPSADVASGTSYLWYRDLYTLPADFRRADQIRDLNWAFDMDRTDLGSLLESRRVRMTPSQPTLYAFTADTKLPNRLAVIFNPPPDIAYNMDYILQRKPYPLRTFDYSTGTVAITAASTTVTGTGTSWTSEMEGSIIRVTSGTDHPTGPDGLNPYTEERVIDQVTSATVLTTTSAFSNSYATKKYRISDRVDIEDGAMMSAFIRCCEYNLSMLLNRADVRDKQQLYRTAMTLAKEADNRGFEPREKRWSLMEVKDYPIGDDIGG